MKRQAINPASTQALAEAYHFAQATRVGDMIWISGQVGIDATMTPGADLEAQADLAFQNLKAALEAAGAGLSDVVELVSYHTDLHADTEGFGQIKDQYLPAPYPSWTAVGVSQLALPELRVEIRAVAVAGCGKP